MIENNFLFFENETCDNKVTRRYTSFETDISSPFHIAILFLVNIITIIYIRKHIPEVEQLYKFKSKTMKCFYLFTLAWILKDLTEYGHSTH